MTLPVFRWCPDLTSRMETEVEMDVTSSGDAEVRRALAPRARRRLVLEFTRLTSLDVCEMEDFFRGVKSGAFMVQDPDRGDFFKATIDSTFRRDRDTGRFRRAAVAVREVWEP